MRVASCLVLVAVLIGGVVTVGAAAFTYVNVRQMVAESPVELPALPQLGSAKPTANALFAATPTAIPTKPAEGTQESSSAEVVPTIPPLSDPSRITILLLGIDQRKGEQGPFRTDTIMLLSLDPIRKTGAMLSIPRDIYLEIPVYKIPERINNANVIGDVRQYPGGGPALAVKAVQELVGVPIQRYAVVNFEVFTTVIDALAPINVCPKEHIHDDHYPDGSYGYITVDFPPGCQDLDSTKLLQYARVRHNAGDDFGRAARQQEVIRAVREKVVSLGGVSALFSKASTIWTSLKDSIVTDLTFDEILQLAQVAQTIPKENIKSAVITVQDGHLQPTKLATGEEVYNPIYEKIHELVASLFNAAPGGIADPQASAENATIVVSNGAGVDGMAKLTADRLREKGFNIIEVKNADLPGGYGRTIIRVYTGKVKTARFLAEVLGLDGTVIEEPGDKPEGVDIEVVVGKDLVQN